MKTKIILLLISLFSFSIYAQDFPRWASDLKYAQLGSCEMNNLSFNAARFTKIPLHKRRDDLDLYLQMIFFFSDGGVVKLRTMEMGLIGCQQTPQGELCSYRPYPETKVLADLSWIDEGEELKISGLGRLRKIRDDLPWRGFQFIFNEDVVDPVLRSTMSVGGKVQVNFDRDDMNSARLCTIVGN